MNELQVDPPRQIKSCYLSKRDLKAVVKLKFRIRRMKA